MVKDFRPILNHTNSLYKTKDFNFWLKTIGETNTDDLPVTKYGYNEALVACRYLHKEDKNRVRGLILYMCEALFTYSHYGST